MIKSVFTFLVFIGISSALSAQEDVFNAARNGDTKTLAKLHSLNPDTINATNAQGYSPVILACYYNQVDLLDLLLTYKVRLNDVQNSPTALQAAAYKGFTKCVEMLLKYGANPNIVDANGTSPLIYAVQFNHQAIAQMLIKNGADVNYKDPNGFSAVDYAKNLNLADILVLFEEN